MHDMTASAAASVVYPASAPRFPLSEVIRPFSYALDLSEGQPRGHGLRCCWVGMRIGQELSLQSEQLRDLYFTLLLKDAGCSSNSARLVQRYGSDDLSIKQSFKLVDSQNLVQVARFVLEHTRLKYGMAENHQNLARLIVEGERLADEVAEARSRKGAEIAGRLGLSQDVAHAIRCLDEHFNGRGRPVGLRGESIPLLSRITLLSQTVEVFFAAGGAAAALEEAEDRGGTWFDPQLVRCLRSLGREQSFWSALGHERLEELVADLEPHVLNYLVDDDQLDHVAGVFAQVIDAKSPFTLGHSSRVAQIADGIAARLGLGHERRRSLKRAALMHDIGKLGVSSAILDKPGRLTEEEFAQLKLHPKFSQEILARISIFQETADIAGAKHERLDGRGYPAGLCGPQIALETRILTVADIFDALTAERPYRAPMAEEKAFKILDEERGKGVDPDCLDALKQCI